MISMLPLPGAEVITVYHLGLSLSFSFIYTSIFKIWGPFYVHGTFALMCICPPCVFTAHGDQKRMLDLLQEFVGFLNAPMRFCFFVSFSFVCF